MQNPKKIIRDLLLNATTVGIVFGVVFFHFVSQTGREQRPSTIQLPALSERLWDDDDCLVTAWQLALNQVIDAQLALDGDYGPLTQAAYDDYVSMGEPELCLDMIAQEKVEFLLDHYLFLKRIN